MAANPLPLVRNRRWRRCAAIAGGLLVVALANPAVARSKSPGPHSIAAAQAATAVADWITSSGDNQRLPFVIVDKVNARVLVFDGRSRLMGTAPALLGLSKGDDSAVGIGTRKLSEISPAERTTPAGRFQAVLGHDLKQDILWVDYEAALSLHRVIVGNPREHRARRLASASSGDNRISYGCINVPAAFYDKVIVPAFTGTVGVVYILPETRPVESVFAIGAPVAPSVRGVAAPR